MTNLRNVLDAAGLTFADVVKTTIFLADMADFAAVNGVYGRFVTDPPPARSTVAGRRAPEGRPRGDRGDRPPARLACRSARPPSAPVPGDGGARRSSLTTGGPTLRSADQMTTDPAIPDDGRADPEPASSRVAPSATAPR